MWHLVVAGVLMAPVAHASDARPGVEKGVVHLEPVGDQKDIPERYRLAATTFKFELEKKRDLPLSEVEIHHLRFPSPVTTDCPENNTVFAEYYRPKGPGPFPGVIVLDITAGNQDLSRLIANSLAQNKIAALFVQMAYYGPRRPPGSKRRLMSTNFVQTIDNVKQTVLDVRCATAWLAARPEVDPKRLGIHGTSLGSMVGALTAEMEPRLGRVSILLGGGGLVDAYYDHPQAASYRRFWEAIGGNKEQVKRVLAPIDPITCAANLKDRKVLMIAGKRDDIVPPKATEALWKAAGEPKLVWFNCSHYGAALYIGPIMEQVVKHFSGEEK
jgi:dienelactone hydrolase